MRRGVAIGEVLAGKYRVDTLLGQGAMGIVVSATQLSNGLRVAVKLLVADDLDPTDHARFMREATIATRLRGAHTVRVLDVGSIEDGTAFLVMELMEGEDLQQVLDREGAQAFENVMSWMLDACVALAEAHDAGIVHRDVKPANLFIVRGGQRGRMLKVVDFGLSKLEADAPERKRLTASTAIFGSPAYMAPEQFVSSSRVDARADIYSLGVTLYELLCGKLPFDAASTAELSAQVMRDPPPLLRSRRADLPLGVEKIVHRCLEKNPRDRYQTVRDLEAALVAALVDPREAPKTIMMLHGPPTMEEPVTLAPPPDRAARTRRWGFVALVSAIVCLIASVLYAVISRY